MIAKEMSMALRKAFGKEKLEAILGKPFSFTYTAVDNTIGVYLSMVSGVNITHTREGKIGTVACYPFPSTDRESFPGFLIDLSEPEPVWRTGRFYTGTTGKLRLL